jgi:hypothetical protein
MTINSPERRTVRLPLRVVKVTAVAAGLQFREDDVGAGQGGVSAQIHFHLRGEPAQVIAVAVRHQKGGFRQVVFGRHFCSRASSGHASSRHTPAGLPEKR